MKYYAVAFDENAAMRPISELSVDELRDALACVEAGRYTFETTPAENIRAQLIIELRGRQLGL